MKIDRIQNPDGTSSIVAYLDSRDAISAARNLDDIDLYAIAADDDNSNKFAVCTEFSDLQDPKLDNLTAFARRDNWEIDNHVNEQPWKFKNQQSDSDTKNI